MSVLFIAGGRRACGRGGAGWWSMAAVLRAGSGPFLRVSWDSTCAGGLDWSPGADEQGAAAIEPSLLSLFLHDAQALGHGG